jgi:hypothetical protein
MAIFRTFEPRSTFSPFNTGCEHGDVIKRILGFMTATDEPRVYSVTLYVLRRKHSYYIYTSIYACFIHIYIVLKLFCLE